MKCVLCRAQIGFADLRTRCPRAEDPRAEELAARLGTTVSPYHRPDNRHKPSGEPCRCGRVAVDHRVNHQPKGDPCLSCGLPSASHITRKSGHSKAVRDALVRRDGWNCQLCGEPFRRPAPLHPHELSVEVDHVVPASKGGTDALGNLRLAHRKCNMARGCGALTPAQERRNRLARDR